MDRRVIDTLQDETGETAEQNQRLIEDVFSELQVKSPEGIRYIALRLADGSFVHFVESDGWAGQSLASCEHSAPFKAASASDASSRRSRRGRYRRQLSYAGE